jgi:hypothetical protein
VDNIELSLPQILALWGAFLSSVVHLGLSEVVLCRSETSSDCYFGMKAVAMPEYSGKTLIHATVSNRGDRATSVTHLCFFFYKNNWRRLRTRPSEKFLITVANTRQPIPFELKVAGMWTGIAVQTEDIEKMIRMVT